jgi:hypothetical protein
MTTRATLFQLIVTLFFLSNGGAQTITFEKHLGEPFSRTEITPISELTTHPEKYFNKDIKTQRMRKAS